MQTCHHVQICIVYQTSYQCRNPQLSEISICHEWMACVICSSIFPNQDGLQVFNKEKSIKPWSSITYMERGTASSHPEHPADLKKIWKKQYSKEQSQWTNDLPTSQMTIRHSPSLKEICCFDASLKQLSSTVPPFAVLDETGPCEILSKGKKTLLFAPLNVLLSNLRCPDPVSATTAVDETTCLPMSPNISHQVTQTKQTSN